MMRLLFTAMAIGFGFIAAQAQDEFDIEEALNACADCAGAEGSPVCVMIVEGEGIQVPNPCYAECIGFPTVGSWFCDGDSDQNEGGDTNGGDTEGGNTEGGNTEGGDTNGGDTEGGDTEGGDTNGGEQDSDGDGLSDDEEGVVGSDDENPDTDGDGLTDGQEVNLFGTSPLLLDTDGNGQSDAVDMALQLVYQVNQCPSDINRDGLVTVADMIVFLGDFSMICPQ